MGIKNTNTLADKEMETLYTFFINIAEEEDKTL